MFELLLVSERTLSSGCDFVIGKRYDRYVDDFINSHRYINCNSAICRNCHEMNIHIVKGLLNVLLRFTLVLICNTKIGEKSDMTKS